MSVKEGLGQLDLIVQAQIEVMPVELDDDGRNCQIGKHCNHTKKANVGLEPHMQMGFFSRLKPVPNWPQQEWNL